MCRCCVGFRGCGGVTAFSSLGFRPGFPFQSNMAGRSTIDFLFPMILFSFLPFLFPWHPPAEQSSTATMARLPSYSPSSMLAYRYTYWYVYLAQLFSIFPVHIHSHDEIICDWVPLFVIPRLVSLCGVGTTDIFLTYSDLFAPFSPNPLRSPPILRGNRLNIQFQAFRNQIRRIFSNANINY